MSEKTESKNTLREEFYEAFREAVSQVKKGYIVTMLTDQFDIQRIETTDFGSEYLKNLFHKALEIRMFNPEREIRWFRSSIDKNLKCRERIDTENMDRLTYWDETQYLDIDDTKSNEADQMVYATGGGIYSLPVKNYKNAKIRVRNYLSYEEDTMQIRISDWRLVDFINKEE